MSPRLSHAALLQIREQLREEQAQLQERIAALRRVIAGLDGLLGEAPAPAPAVVRSGQRPKTGGRPQVIPSEEWPAIAARVANGELQTLIAQEYGLSRERIRQITQHVDPTAAERGQQFRKLARTEQRRMLTEVRRVQRAMRVGPCRVCLGPVTREPIGPTRGEYGKQTCSARCAALWVRCRYHLDEEVWEKHRLAVARTTLRHAQDPTKRRSAERVLNGTAGTHGRWTLPEHGRVAEAMQEVAALRAAIEESGESWWRT